MKKTFFIALATLFLVPQAGFVSSSNGRHGVKTTEDFPVDINNPSLMHMRRREFIAAGIAQGLAASGNAKSFGQTPETFAKEVMKYTHALMIELDKEDN